MADSKAYTVHIEPDQNLQEIRSTVESLPDGHVILLAPNGSRVLRTVAAMRLVRRTVSPQWAVAIVSPDSEIQASGRLAGLNVHRSFSQASHAIAAGEYGQKGAGLGPAGVAMAGATGLGLICLLLATFVFGTWTEVVLEPMSRQVEGTLGLDLSREFPVQPGQISVREHAKVVELSHHIETTGVIHQVERQSRGVVTFANRREQAIAIPAGTSLWTDSGVRFFTNAPVDLPASTNSKVRVNVIAEEPGESANLPRLSITKVDDRFAEHISVYNEQATEGGGLFSVNIVTEADMARLRSSVLEMARDDAITEIATTIDADTLAIVALSKLSVVDEQFSHKLGDESKRLQIHSKVLVRTPLVSAVELRQAVSDLWNVSLPVGWSIKPSSVEIIETKPRIEEESIKLIVAGRGRAARDIMDSEVVSTVRLKSAVEAREALMDKFPLASQPLVSVHPSWPGISLRVNVHIKDEGAPQQVQNAQS